MTVNGPVPLKKFGTVLTHEHILVDFIGADQVTDSRWDREKVASAVLPYLREVKRSGCNTIIECTPEYLGRDPLLLKMLADSTGLNLVTNTGYYGAGNNKYLPGFVYNEPAEELSERWTKEWNEGIKGTGIRPGFIKTGVGGDTLSELHNKLVKAAALTHLKTGLNIASHTGPAVLAFAELEILKEQGVSPEAFIWVHAQNEKDVQNHIRAAKMGAWVSFDGLSDENVMEYAELLQKMKNENLLTKVLISHDAGWYDPSKPDGGVFRGYTTVFTKLIPELKKKGFTDKEINLLLVKNPAKAFAIK
jgi:phosphotriesterase-related protein